MLRECVVYCIVNCVVHFSKLLVNHLPLYLLSGQHCTVSSMSGPEQVKLVLLHQGGWLLLVFTDNRAFILTFPGWAFPAGFSNFLHLIVADVLLEGRICEAPFALTPARHI